MTRQEGLNQNRLRGRLAAGEAAVGCFVRYHDANLVELTAMLGWDFLVFDGEHGAIDLSDVSGLCRACDLHNVSSLARIPPTSELEIARALDAGVHGIVLPGLTRTEDVARAMSRMRYPPFGVRGLAGTRAAKWGLHETLGQYTVRANRQTLTIVQVEHIDAVRLVDEWVTLDGLDVLFIGPVDLAASMGHPGDLEHSDVTAAIDRVTRIVVGSSKTLGVFVSTPEQASAWIQRGARFLATGLEGLLIRSSRDFIPTVREASESLQPDSRQVTGEA